MGFAIGLVFFGGVTVGVAVADDLSGWVVLSGSLMAIVGRLVALSNG